jgi:predicted extracellular nuclease
MKNIILFSLTFSIITSLLFTACQTPKQFLVVSYNVENLFDTLKNSGGLDTEYIPESKKEYNTEKYNNKLANISKVLSSMDEKKLPDIVGLIEVENRAVLEDLIKQPSLAKSKYGISHFEGPDPRGIEVAMLYSQRFSLLSEAPVYVYTDPSRRFRSRDILYVKGLVEKDTIHVFVNHWKSRAGGEEKTQGTRVIAAQTLRHYTDSLLKRNPQSKLVIMGDFNDNPTDSSLFIALGAGKPGTDSKLINIMFPLFEEGKGTHFYRNEFNMLDNLIVSQAVLKNKKGIRSDGKGYIFAPEWICYKTNRGILAPSRTFSGDKYFNGFSDHFPIYFYLFK